MKRRSTRQKSEKTISAALRIALVAVLFLMQLALTFLLAHFLQDRAAYVYAALEIGALICAVYVSNRRETPAYKLSWVLLLLAVPAAGLILFWLWSGNRQSKQLSLKKLPPPGEPESARIRSGVNMEKLNRAYPQWTRLACYIQKRGFLLYQDTQAKYLGTGKAFFADLLDAMRRAERFIFLEYFIFAEGELWNDLVAVMEEKVHQGVEVKVIYDDFGNLGRFSSEALAQLREMGVEVRVFNPVHQYVNRLYFNYRDHRKIACVDGSVAYTGGMNVGDEYADIIRRFGYWKDSGVRLTGEGAWGLTSQFIHMWEMLDGFFENEHDFYRCHTESRGAGFCQPFGDGPNNNPDNPAEEAFLQLITSARHTLYITTPYFAVDDAMITALCIAGDGGVDVRLMLPGVPDKKYAYMLAESYFGELMTHGVKIYNYTSGFLHSKSVMVDREAAFVGTVNMDYRSFQLHYECGVLLYGSPAVEELTEDMDHILEVSRPMTMEQWEKRSWLRRTLQSLLRLVAIWM